MLVRLRGLQADHLPVCCSDTRNIQVSHHVSRFVAIFCFFLVYIDSIFVILDTEVTFVNG